MKTVKWISLAVLAVVLGVVLLVLRGVFAGPRPDRPGRLPDVPPKVKEKADRAYEEMLKAKVESRVTAEEDKKEIEEILSVSDGAERRKRLAEKLRRL